MAITETVTIDMTPGGIMPIAYASQYDAGGRVLAILLMSHGTPYNIPDGAAVQIRGTKADGKGFAYAGTAEGSTAYFTLEQQMTAAAGDAICEVRITDADGGIIGTANFILRVEPAGLADDTDTSATEIPAIEDAAKAAAERAEAAAKKAEEAASGGTSGGAGGTGADGVSTTVEITAIDGGNRITITDKNGAHTADVMDGKNGADGADGAAGPAGKDGTDGTDGVSPTVSFTAITGGTRLTITDANGQHSADIMNGSDGAAGAAGDPGPSGKDGKDGADGMSPSVSVAQNDTGATITITDKSGAHSVTLTNGKDGKDGANGAAGEPGPAGADGKNGKDGVSPSVSIAQTSTGATITITDASGAHTATILNGTDGERGPAGEAGKDGKDGKNGADGEAATVTIGTVTTGESGTSATVTNSGTANAAVLDFVIPRGATGPAYTLTDSDKSEIVSAVLAQMTNAESEAL